MPDISTLSLSPELDAFLEPEQKRLIQDSLQLLAYFETCEDVPEEVHDFAFLVFPIAKAYEGFLKTYFHRHGLISQDVYRGRHFRVGRSFNPDLPNRLRDEHWLYDDVARNCGNDLAHLMWQVWIDARNHLFHYFPDQRYMLTPAQAQEIVKRVLDAMHRAVLCKWRV